MQLQPLADALLGQAVLHADETPVKMLAPGRSGEHARDFLGDWSGKLVCDDYSGYKASFSRSVIEIGCMAHARRKFFDLQASGKSQLAAQALGYIGQLYDIERESKELEAKQRQQLREEKARPIADALHQWMQAQRQRVPDGSAIAKALDYSLKRWVALSRYKLSIRIRNRRL